MVGKQFLGVIIGVGTQTEVDIQVLHKEVFKTTKESRRCLGRGLGKGVDTMVQGPAFPVKKQNVVREGIKPCVKMVGMGKGMPQTPQR